MEIFLSNQSTKDRVDVSLREYESLKEELKTFELEIEFGKAVTDD